MKRGWFECLMVAREDGMPFDEAIAELEATPGRRPCAPGTKRWRARWRRPRLPRPQ